GAERRRVGGYRALAVVGADRAVVAEAERRARNGQRQLRRALLGEILRRRQRALEVERLALGHDSAAAGERLVHGGEREARVDALEAAPGAIALVAVAHGAVGDADVVERQRGDLARLGCRCGTDDE